MNIAISYNGARIHRIAVSVFFFVAGLTFASWASRIPDIKNQLQLTEAGLGTVLFALPAGQLVSLPFSGWLITRFGSRQLLIIAAIFYPVTLVFLGLADTTWQLVSALFIFGLWANLINIAMNTQAVAVENLYGRSIMASFHGLWSLAGFAGALAGSFFVSSGFNPFVHFMIICIAAVMLAVTSFKFTLPAEPRSSAVRQIFRWPGKAIMILGLIAFCCMVCEGAMADWSGVYIQNIVKASPSKATLGYVAFMSTMATGRFIGDWLITRFGVRSMLQASGVLITTGLAIAVIFPFLSTTILGFLLVGFGVSCVVPMVYGLAGKTSDLSAGAALTAVSTIGFLGFLAGPPLIGLIAEATSLRLSFALIALLGLGTALLARKVKLKT